MPLIKKKKGVAVMYQKETLDLRQWSKFNVAMYHQEGTYTRQTSHLFDTLSDQAIFYLKMANIFLLSSLGFSHVYHVLEKGQNYVRAIWSQFNFMKNIWEKKQLA